MCREQLPVWQRFYEQHKGENFEIVGIAMDAASPDQARRFYEQAGVTFVRAIDGADALWETLGFQVVPNGVFLDEHGIVRYAKFGGFEGRNATDRAEIERLLAAPATAAVPAASSATQAAGSSEARMWFRRGVEAIKRGDKQAAASHWRKALELDPGNFVIRKQIWSLEHPEQFYPAINPQWQREQLAKERAK